MPVAVPLSTFTNHVTRFLDALFYAIDGNFHANLKGNKRIDEDDFPLSKGAAYFANEDAFAAFSATLPPLGPEVRQSCWLKDHDLLRLSLAYHVSQVRGHGLWSVLGQGIRNSRYVLCAAHDGLTRRTRRFTEGRTVSMHHLWVNTRRLKLPVQVRQRRLCFRFGLATMDGPPDAHLRVRHQLPVPHQLRGAYEDIRGNVGKH